MFTGRSVEAAEDLENVGVAIITTELVPGSVKAQNKLSPDSFASANARDAVHDRWGSAVLVNVSGVSVVLMALVTGGSLVVVVLRVRTVTYAQSSGALSVGIGEQVRLVHGGGYIRQRPQAQQRWCYGCSTQRLQPQKSGCDGSMQNHATRHKA